MIMNFLYTSHGTHMTSPLLCQLSPLCVVNKFEGVFVFLVYLTNLSLSLPRQETREVPTF